MKPFLPRPDRIPDIQDATPEIRARTTRSSPRPQALRHDDLAHPDLARLQRTPSSDAHTPWSLELRAGAQLSQAIHLLH